MKEQILPPLPIVGRLKLSTQDGKTLHSMTVVKGRSSKKLDPFFKHCFEELNFFLLGEKSHLDIDVDLSSLSLFQQKVLTVMKNIPYGKVSTYKEIADALNCKAYQAVGNACGQNPFMLIYPCHRVLGTNNPGGFAHGLKMKLELLKMEGVSIK